MSKAYKRLIVLSDGTWQNEASVTPTNILKLAKCVASESDDGIQQVLYYDSGVGTGGAVDAMLGGAMGVGIDVNIKEIYIWLACNYDEGDEIYMFGFSRGSYTVRSLSGFIYNCGLVRQEEISHVNVAYEVYRSPGLSPSSEKSKLFRKEHSLRPIDGDRVRITLLCCFDTVRIFKFTSSSKVTRFCFLSTADTLISLRQILTYYLRAFPSRDLSQVGALGIPDSAIGGKFDDGRYAFHDTTLSSTILNAIHLLRYVRRPFVLSSASSRRRSS